MKKLRLSNKIGISYTYGPEDWGSTLEHIDSSIFKVTEIPGEFLEIKNIADEFSAAGMEIVNVKEPLPLPVARSIYGQDRKLVGKIMRQLAIMMRSISRYPCSNITIDFGIDLAVSNPEKKESLISFMKELAPSLHKEEMCLCIPSRIPMPPPATAESYFSFLKEAMYGGIRFSADIHPHELHKVSSIEDLIKWYRFDLNLVRFIYEPETGNLIVGKIIEDWFDVLNKISYRGPVLFCPKITSSGHFINECERLSELIVNYASREKPGTQ